MGRADAQNRAAAERRRLKAVYQTRTGRGGNCLQAALASLLVVDRYFSSAAGCSSRALTAAFDR
jgi:hypothetical protein